jgi:hypothetical protein
MIKEILIKLGLDASGAKDGLNKAEQDLSKFEKTADKAKKQTGSLVDATEKMPGVMGSAVTSVRGLIGSVNTLTAALLANPIGAIIAAIAVQLGILVAIFKDFAPLTDFISDKIAYLSGLFRGLQTAMFNFANGAEFATEAITEQAKAMERANQMQRAYEDNIDSLNLKQAQYEAQIDKLLKQAKNKAISDKQANDFIKQATELQAIQINQLKEVSRLETSMLVERAKGYGATYKQILAIQQGASVESLGNLSNELDAALSELQKNYTKRVEEVGSLESRSEKIRNVSDSLAEKRKAKQEKEAADKLKKEEEEKKRQEAEGKDRAERAKEYDQKVKKQQEYERERKKSLDTADREKYEQDVADLKAIKDDELLKDKERFAAIDELRAKGILSEKEAADAKIAIAEKENDAKIALLNGYSSVLMSISDLAGRETVAGKALAVAATTIDTYVAAFRAYKEGFKIDPTGTLSIINASAATITGIAAVRKILSVQVPNGGGGGGGSAPSLSLPTTRPSSGFTTLGNENPLRTTNEGGMVKVFVTESDITNSQNKVSSIQAKATIG